MELRENQEKITDDDKISKYLITVFLLQDNSNVINLKRKMDNELANLFIINSFIWQNEPNSYLR